MEGPDMSVLESAPPHLRNHLPDFLIISPPKTGSTWLAFNLQCHPDVFVPDMKELKYFSLYHRWLGLDWYTEHFHAAGVRLKGEASPSYALLPCAMIRQIHALMPRLKLVFLMRDPVARPSQLPLSRGEFRELPGRTADSSRRGLARELPPSLAAGLGRLPRPA